MVEREQCAYFIEFIEKSRAPHSVILLEGARQVGKTTFVSQVSTKLTNVLAFNLEEDVVLRAEIDATADFADFEALMRLKKFRPQEEQIIVIDEAQESERLGAYVRFMKEKWLNTKVILTGSSMTRLFREEQRIPVGRYVSLKLQPFSFLEFLKALDREVLIEQIKLPDPHRPISTLLHEKLLEAMDRYLEVGGLPEVVVSYDRGLDYKTIRRAVLLSQQEDFVRKTSLGERDLFIDALRGVVNFLGGPSKYTHVSEQTKLAKKIVAVMQAWHIIHEIEQKGISSTSSFYPKRYCYDLGVAQAVRNMPFPSLSLLKTIDSALRTQLGGLFENLVYLALMNYKMGQITLSSWKESSQNETEVDFVWHDRQPIPIECKASLKTSPRTFANLRSYLRASGGKVGFLVSAAPFEKREEGSMTLYNLPIYLCRPEIIHSLVDAV